MRTRFWRKKNAKLEKRLSNVIETTERARKTIQALPSRVTIDTSYVEPAEDLYDEEFQGDSSGYDDNGAWDGEAGSASGMDAARGLGLGFDAVEMAMAMAPDDLAAVMLNAEPDPVEPEEPGPLVVAVPQEDLAAERREWLEASEQAEQQIMALREALKAKDLAVRNAQAALDTERAAREAAEDARLGLVRKAEDAEKAMLAAQAAGEARDRLARSAAQSRETDLADKRAIEAERDELARRLRSSEAELAELRANPAGAVADAAEMAQQIEDAKAAQAATEKQRAELARKLEVVEAELRQSEAKLAADAEAHAESRQKLAGEQSALAHSEDVRAELCAKLQSVEDERARLAQQVAEAEGTLEGLRRDDAARGGELQAAIEALQRETRARQTAENERDEVLARVRTAEAEAVQLRQSGEARDAVVEKRFEAERSTLLSRVADAARELEELRQGQTTRDGELKAAQAEAQREAEARQAAARERDEAVARLEGVEVELQAVLQAGETRYQAERSELLSRVTEAESALETLRQGHAERGDELQDAKAAVKREMTARSSAEVERDEVLARSQTMEAQLQELRQAGERRVTAAEEKFDAERSGLLSRLADVEAKLAEAVVLAESRDAALKAAAEARGREAAQRHSIIAERDEWQKKALRAEADAARVRFATQPKVVDAVVPQSPAMPGGVSTIAEEDEAEVTATGYSEAERSAGDFEETEPDTGADDPTPAADSLHAPPSDEKPAEQRAASTRAGRDPHDRGEADATKRTPPPSEPRKRYEEPKPPPVVEDDDKRRLRRASSQMPVTLWREGMGQPLACSLKDRSPSGARVEFPRHSLIEGFSAFNEGDHVTLTLNSAHERTWVGCEVVWVRDNACGLRFLGQFRSEVPAVRKTARQSAADKSARSKAGSRLSSLFLNKG